MNNRCAKDNKGINDDQLNLSWDEKEWLMKMNFIQ
jgi:hypothetical protein